jgi:hypothetical protein
VAAFTLPGLPESLTARELIRLRVREEVARYNAAPAPRFRGLVQPAGAEADAAERAFARNGFFMLAGDRQIEDLDDVIPLTGDPEVAFIRLIPLAGG